MESLAEKIAKLQADTVTALGAKEDLDGRMRDLQAAGAALHRQSAHEKEQAQHRGRTEPDVQIELSDVLSAELLLLPELAMGGSETDKYLGQAEELAMALATMVHARSWQSMELDENGVPSPANFPNGLQKKVLYYYEQQTKRREAAAARAAEASRAPAALAGAAAGAAPGGQAPLLAPPVAAGVGDAAATPLPAGSEDAMSDGDGEDVEEEVPVEGQPNAKSRKTKGKVKAT